MQLVPSLQDQGTKRRFTSTLVNHPYQELCPNTRSLLSMSSRRCRESIASSRSWITRIEPARHHRWSTLFSLNFPVWESPSPIRLSLLFGGCGTSIDNTGASMDLPRPSLPVLLSTTCPGHTTDLKNSLQDETTMHTLASTNRLLSFSRGEKRQRERERERKEEENTRETHEPTAGEAPWRQSATRW